MKIKFLFMSALLLAVVSEAAWAEWVKVASTDKVTAYADPSSIKKKGNIVRIWSLFDFKEENMLNDGNTYFSVMRETEFNCKDNLQHMISYSIHSANMGKGKVVDKGGEPQEWKAISQNNIAISMWAHACGK